MRDRQKGISLIGTMIAAAMVIGAIILAMRMVPVYNEYFAIKKALNVVASSGEATSPEAIRSQFGRKADVEDISTVKPSDLVIAKENGRWVISAEWQRTIPLVANVSLLFQFSVSSAGNLAANQ